MILVTVFAEVQVGGVTLLEFPDIAPRLCAMLSSELKEVLRTTPRPCLIGPIMNKALALAENWAAAYRDAGPTIRRQMNQAIFKKIYVDDEGGVTSEFSEPFELLLSSEVVEAARDHA